jgi:hypothetical protein
MSRRIASASRISDLLHDLSNPVEYVTGAVRNFGLYGFDRSTCKIRIGAAGTGKFPNYRIEEPSVPEPFGMTMTPACIFSGRNHREMTELYDYERHDRNWSAKTMSYAELIALSSTLDSATKQ